MFDKNVLSNFFRFYRNLSVSRDSAILSSNYPKGINNSD